MRLLLRHLRRRILSSPKESIVILVTVLLSVFLFAMLGELYHAFREEEKIADEIAYGHADLIVTPTAASPSRFLSHTVTEPISGDSASRVGVLALPFHDPHGDGFSVAADLAQVADVCAVSLSDVAVLPAERMDRAAYITASFAEARGLGVGSCFTVSLAGEACEFEVYGIQEYAFFGRYDFLLHDEAVLKILSGVSPVFSVFDRDNMPYTAIYITLADGRDAAQIAAQLRAEDDTLSVYCTEDDDSGFTDYALAVTLWAVISLTVVIAGCLVGFSLRVLSEERRGETEAFRLAGMGNRTLMAGFLIELAAYLACGLGGGLLLSYLVLPILFDGSLHYASLHLTPWGVCIAVMGCLLVGGFSLLSHAFLMKTRRGSRSRLPVVVILCAIAVITLMTVAVPVAIRYWFAAVDGVFVLLAALLVLPRACRRVMYLLSRRGGKRGSGAAWLLALKNHMHIREMRYLSAALGLVVATALSLIACLTYCNDFIEKNEQALRADYLVAGAPYAAADDIAALPGSDASASVFLAEGVMPSGQEVSLLSVSDSTFLTDGMQVTPQGNEMFLSRTVARRAGLRLGDEVTVTLAKQEYTFIVKGYLFDNCVFCVINAADIGLREDGLLVRGEDSDAYLDTLSREMSFYGAFTERIDSVMQSRTTFAHTFCDLLGGYTAIVMVLACVGCFNLLYVCYGRRRAHFASFVRVGMTRGEIVRMVTMEGGILFLVVFTTAALTAGGIFLCFNSALQSFGFCLTF